MDATTERLKQDLDIDVANCRTCTRGHAESNGDMRRHYCERIDGDDGDDVYVEDRGLDPDTEKSCWVPDFWASRFADELEGTHDHTIHVIHAFRRRVETIRASADDSN